MLLPYEPKTKRKEQDYWNQLANATNSRNSEDYVLWIIISVFTAAHSILIATLVSVLQKVDYSILTGLSLFALNLSIVQRIIQNRALGHLKMYEDLIANLEQQLKIPSDFVLSGHYDDKRWDEYLGKSLSARKAISYLVYCLILIWSVIFIYTVIKMIY